MLSIKVFSSAGGAEKYYSHGDYYGSEGEGTWLGDGAKELGLSGNFTAKNNQQFSDLLNGILPNGQVLGKKTANGLEHRPGTDFTFSVPKSFSIQMLLNASPDEKKAMEEAVMSAVTKTLKFIEKEGYVFARRGHAGRIEEKLSKLAFATFMHTTNRNLEPQIHVHSFLANIALCEDGKIRSITNDHLLEHSKFFGQLFRNELALETKKLGHEINTTILSDGSTSFELANIHPKMILGFSTRRQEIVELFKYYGVTTKEGRDKIVINSRKAKQLVTEEQLQKTWKEIEQKIQKEIEIEKSNSQSERHNDEFTPQATWLSRITSFFSSGEKEITESVSVLSTSDDIKSDSSNLSAKDIAKLAIEDVSYNKTIFSSEELLKNLLKFGIGNYSVVDLKQEVNRFEKEGLLIRHGNQFTTKAHLDREQQILKYAANSIGSSKQMIKSEGALYQTQKFETREIAKKYGFKMNEQQRCAIKHILTSQDKIITMEGLPGVGKSTVLNAVRDITGRKIINLVCNPLGLGEKFKGAAPTASAAKTLKESANIDSQTLHGFFGKYTGYIEDRGSQGSLKHFKQEYKNTIVFVDEASLVSTNMMHQLLKLQEKFGFRLVMTGDTKQLSSVEAGKPFEQMLDIIKPIKLQEIVRQKDQTHRDAVIAASKGDITKTFEIHDKNITQTECVTLAKSASQLYLEKSQYMRDNTLLISPTRALRDQINNEIRQALQQENSLKDKEHNFTALKPKNMSISDRNFAYSYNPGDIIKFNQKYKNGINKGDYLTVKSINQISNNLVLEKNGKPVIFTLKQNTNYTKKLEVFNETNLKLQEGLKIIFTKNNKEHGLINSETAVIEKIGSNSHSGAYDRLLLKFEDGTNRSIRTSQLKHIDYGYCVTVHAAQGKTYENTIAAINNNKLLNTAKMWLVAISRHKSEFTALVEDKQQLKAYLMKNKGNELSATELQSKSLQNNTSGLSTTTELNVKSSQSHSNEPVALQNSHKNTEIKKTKDFQMEM